jgi:hypothetical protein
VREWANQVWRAWSPHHAAISELAAECFENPGRRARRP